MLKLAPLIKPLTAGAILGLLAALSSYQLLSAAKFNPAVFTLQALPLLLVLPGIVKGHRRAYQWCGFIILLYFVRSIILLSSAKVVWIDYVLLVASVVIFVLSLLGSRLLVAHPTP